MLEFLQALKIQCFTHLHKVMEQILDELELKVFLASNCVNVGFQSLKFIAQKMSFSQGW